MHAQLEQCIAYYAYIENLYYSCYPVLLLCIMCSTHTNSAAASNAVGVCALLFLSGADISYIDNDHCSCLDVAVLHNAVQVVEYLSTKMNKSD
jgi:Ankyrin repeats (many copies)